MCGRRLVSKGFVKRQMLTLVGTVEWKRRVGRCPQKCSGSQQIPFDVTLGIQSYQQTSTELIRLGCLLAIFLPFDLSAQLLRQLTGITISDATIWNWVQMQYCSVKVCNCQCSGQNHENSSLSASDKSQFLVIRTVLGTDDWAASSDRHKITTARFIGWTITSSSGTRFNSQSNALNYCGRRGDSTISPKRLKHQKDWLCGKK